MISFWVEGEPRPKQSFRVSGHGRGFTPAAVKAWQTDVAIAAEVAMRNIGRFNQPMNGMLAAQIDFGLGNYRRVDLDNLNKAVFDGLNKIVFEDDKQVFDLHLRKHIVERPGVKAFIGNQAEIDWRLFVELFDRLDREDVAAFLRSRKVIA